MTRRRRYLVGGGAVLTVVALATVLAPVSTQGATAFANPAFQQQWESLERVIPNFYGPLSTAFDATTEPYVEGQYNGQTGVRIVQYFDKARLEQITPQRRITSGLLTVELKTGNLQLGDNTFSQNPPAYIGIAGDPGGGGPTYADLGQLPEKVAQSSGSVNLKWDASTNTYTAITALSNPQTAFAQYLSDPSGRYGQNVPKAFADFLKKIPGGYLLPMGYPIGPAFVANVRLKGVANVQVVVQPFQRRVLTYTASNRPQTQVEFGNIGRHYYQWRTALPNANPTSITNTLTPPMFITNTPAPTATFSDTATPTATPSDTATPTASTTPTGTPDINATNVAGTATQAAATATASVFQGTATTVANLATGTSLTATAAVLQATQDSINGAATNTAETATAFGQTATAVVQTTQAASGSHAVQAQIVQATPGSQAIHAQIAQV